MLGVDRWKGVVLGLGAREVGVPCSPARFDRDDDVQLHGRPVLDVGTVSMELLVGV